MKDLVGLLVIVAVLFRPILVNGAAAGGEREQALADSTAASAQELAEAGTGPDAENGPKELLNPPKPGDVWWMREGKGYTLCEAVYKELQHYTPKQLGVCVPSVALPLPGMKELDGWKELDTRQHEGLYKRLMQYDSMRARNTKLDDARLDYLYQEFLKMDGRMRVNTLRVFRRPLGNPPPVTTYDQPQTIVELRRSTNKELCPQSPSLTDMVRTFYVTADLAGPSPDIREFEAHTASHARLIQYKGVLHLMSGTDQLMFLRDFGDGSLHPFCEIPFLKAE